MRGKVVIYDDDLYFPLFVKGGTRYKVVMGGRGSAKSYTISTALLVRSYEDDGTILFTRYTLTNAEVSILPEFLDKIKRLDWGGDFVQTGNDIVNKRSGGKILFRGIKTSSGINTAALKSIPKLKMWVNDESEELVDETVFDTIDLSIRYNNAPGEVWIVANPPDIDHFLYRRFFKERGIEDVWNGVKDDVTYIHTTYLNNPYLPPEYIALAERCKEVDREKYEHIWLGHFATHKEGLIYKGWHKDDDFFWPAQLPCWYGVDWGFANDPAAVVRVAFEPVIHTVWVKELMYETGMLTADIARVIREDIYNRHREHEVGDKRVFWAKGKLFREELTGTTEIPRGEDFDKHLVEAGFVGWEVDDIREWVAGIERLDGEIYCDPARPEQIREMKINHGLWAMAAVNTDKVGRIEYLKYFDVRFIGENIDHEVRNYRWQTSKTDKTQYINKPQDGGDHCFTGDTIVETTRGPRYIMAIEKGEYVITSDGPKKVIHTWYNGRKKVWKYRLNFVSLCIEIKATKEHKVKTAKGWKPISKLQAGDEIFLLKSLMENSTTSTREKNTSLGITSDCTASCGNTTTARSLRGITSTIRTAILRIMTSVTSNLSKDEGTKANTSSSKTQTPISLRQKSDGCSTPENLQKNGIEAKKGGRGIVDTQKSKSALNKNVSARFAELDTNRTDPIPSIARQSATQRRGAIAGLITKLASAKSAERSSRQAGSGRQDFAVSLVLQSIEEVYIGKHDVYDLTVSQNHEYNAEGVVVHNCMDAISYGAVTHLRRLGIANKLGEK